MLVTDRIATASHLSLLTDGPMMRFPDYMEGLVFTLEAMLG